MRADLGKSGADLDKSRIGLHKSRIDLDGQDISDLLEAELNGSGAARSEAAGGPGVGGAISHAAGVLGWFCTYTPEEILLAAGLDSRKIFGTFNPVRSADTYLGSNLCPYVKSCLEGAIKGSYGTLDGVIMTTSCNAMCHLYNAWQRARAGDGFCYMLNVPRFAPQVAWTRGRSLGRGTGGVAEGDGVVEEPALDYWERELRRLMKELSSRFGSTFSDESLYEAIRTCNETRELLHSVYQLNRVNGNYVYEGTHACQEEYGCGQMGSGDAAGQGERGGLAGHGSGVVTISGTDLARIVKMSMSYPKSRFNAALGGILARLSHPYSIPGQDTSGTSNTARPGIFVAGSVCDAPVAEIIEEAGARVVADDLCTGMRYFTGQVDIDEAERSGDFVRAIARRYLNKVPCARMYHASSRFEHVYELVRESGAKGIVFYGLKFCDPYLYDHIGLRRGLEEKGIPVLFLEGDYTAGGAGQARTRVEAFVEMISSIS